MLLINDPPSTPDGTFSDTHYVPTIHLRGSSRAAIRAYASRTGATASLMQYALTYNAEAPNMLDLSSRGPPITDEHALKPDITGWWNFNHIYVACTLQGQDI
jgi:hypothetical protein